MTRWVGCLGIVAALGACGGASKPIAPTDGGSQDGGWQSQLAEAIAATPFYSLRFPDEGAIFTVGFVAGAPGASCGALAGAFDAGSDLWELQVVLPSAELGVYPVVAPALPYASSVSDAGALVALEHQDAAARADYVFFASNGAVTVMSAPEDGGAQKAGEHLMGVLTNVNFPADAIALGACEGAPAGTCSCDDLDGNVLSTCDGGPATCCQSTAQAAISVNLTFDALPCAALCTSDFAVDAGECEALSQ